MSLEQNVPEQPNTQLNMPIQLFHARNATHWHCSCDAMSPCVRVFQRVPLVLFGIGKQRNLKEKEGKRFRKMTKRKGKGRRNEAMMEKMKGEKKKRKKGLKYIGKGE